MLCANAANYPRRIESVGVSRTLYIQCHLRPGFRDDEVDVTVHDITGRPERLRIDRGCILQQDGQSWLPIGIVARHPTEDRILIEFPHAADSGANRMFAAPEAFLPNPPDWGQAMTDDDIRREGLAALRGRLGRTGLIRFLQQFDVGRGDYAAERRGWVDQTSLDDIRDVAGP